MGEGMRVFVYAGDFCMHLVCVFEGDEGGSGGVCGRREGR